MSVEVNPRNIVVDKLKNLLETTNNSIESEKKINEQQINSLSQSIEKGIYNKNEKILVPSFSDALLVASV